MVGIIFICINFAKNIFLMNKILKLVCFLSLFGFYAVDAQQVVKKDTLNGTELTVTMDSKVDDLLKDLESKCDRLNDIGNKPITKVEVNTKTKTKVVCNISLSVTMQRFFDDPQSSVIAFVSVRYVRRPS